MSVKHVLEGVMQWTGARTPNRCSVLLGLDESTISRIYNGKQRCLNMATVDQIQKKSGVPIETLFAWYRMPEGAHLGRIKERTRNG